MRGARTGVHLYRATGLAYDKLIAKALREISRAIGASALGDDNFSASRSLAQVSQEWSYQRRLVEDRNNDRDLHWNSFSNSPLKRGSSGSPDFARKFGFELE
jgi:hypothetical protein